MVLSAQHLWRGNWWKSSPRKKAGGVKAPKYEGVDRNYLCLPEISLTFVGNSWICPGYFREISWTVSEKIQKLFEKVIRKIRFSEFPLGFRAAGGKRTWKSAFASTFAPGTPILRSIWPKVMERGGSSQLNRMYYVLSIRTYRNVRMCACTYVTL